MTDKTHEHRSQINTYGLSFYLACLNLTALLKYICSAMCYLTTRIIFLVMHC